MRNEARSVSPGWKGSRLSARERGYTTQWQKARAAYLRAHPLCEACLKRGIIEAASVVDHIVPHKGDAALFWDPSNWQSLSKRCHDSYKQALEHGHVRGADADGVPLDPAHHWRARAPEREGVDDF